MISFSLFFPCVRVFDVCQCRERVNNLPWFTRWHVVCAACMCSSCEIALLAYSVCWTRQDGSVPQLDLFSLCSCPDFVNSNAFHFVAPMLRRDASRWVSMFQRQTQWNSRICAHDRWNKATCSGRSIGRAAAVYNNSTILQLYKSCSVDCGSPCN